MSRGGRGLLATISGAVACELEPLGIDDSGARYELRITNGTPGVLAATVSALRLDESRPVAALAVEVQPHAALRTGFSLDASVAYERVTADVRGEGIHMLVEAPPPRGGRPRRRWVGLATALGAAGLLAGATLIGVAAERPRVVEATLLDGPNGGTVAKWVTAGNGSRTYELRDARGDVVAHGALPSAAGSMVVAIPSAASLRVVVANAFGSDARDAVYARATAPPAIRIVATPPPRIESIAVDAARPGGAVAVRYAARARDLHLSVVDRTGATWFATTTPSGTGTVQIPAPPAGGREPYLLVARAEGQDAREETRVPFPAAVAPSPSASAVAEPTGPASARPARNGIPPEPTVLEGGGGDTFAIRQDPAPGGGSFVVTLPSSDGARVQIVRDRDGIEVAGADVRRGERSVTLAAPVQPGSYTVRVTMQRGRGIVSLVRSLQVRRRP
ncbi:MAG: hypothetical protein QOF71_2375 [Candidatus Eremiobacteraeota bacterium]|nr:hypothetical protein [Candidatus Eremiobacteraeota bacterium]